MSQAANLSGLDGARCHEVGAGTSFARGTQFRELLTEPKLQLIEHGACSLIQPRLAPSLNCNEEHRYVQISMPMPDTDTPCRCPDSRDGQRPT